MTMKNIFSKIFKMWTNYIHFEFEGLTIEFIESLGGLRRTRLTVIIKYLYITCKMDIG